MAGPTICRNKSGFTLSTPQVRLSIDLRKRAVGCWEGGSALYDGGKATTQSGRTCMEWARDDPHGHSLYHLPSNFCSNADGVGGTPWCYTTDPDVRWEDCEVPLCPSPPPPPTLPAQPAEEVGCYTGDGESYEGHAMMTGSGLVCQAWASQEPHDSDFTSLCAVKMASLAAAQRGASGALRGTTGGSRLLSTSCRSAPAPQMPAGGHGAPASPGPRR